MLHGCLDSDFGQFVSSESLNFHENSEFRLRELNNNNNNDNNDNNNNNNNNKKTPKESFFSEEGLEQNELSNAD